MMSHIMFYLIISYHDASMSDSLRGRLHPRQVIGSELQHIGYLHVFLQVQLRSFFSRTWNVGCWIMKL